MQERNFLCATISIELAVSTLFYISRILLLPGLHPDLVLAAYCLRMQLSTTITLVLVFGPKFWYQHKQVRSLAQEYSCRIPVDAFKVGIIMQIIRYSVAVRIWEGAFK